MRALCMRRVCARRAVRLQELASLRMLSNLSSGEDLIVLILSLQQPDGVFALTLSFGLIIHK